MKQVFWFLLEIIQIIVIALVIVVPIRYFIFQPFVVKGASMEPNFQDGNYLLVDELSYRFKDPARGEVIVFKYPKDETQRFIKRLIGLPGEQILLDGSQIKITQANGNVIDLDESKYLPKLIYFTNQTFTLANDEFFVLGDNRFHSFDSRGWGLVKRNEIIGRVALRLWPLTAIDYLLEPEY
jgi:signal peptidase I